jgi:hypothetical protein
MIYIKTLSVAQICMASKRKVNGEQFECFARRYNIQGRMVGSHQSSPYTGRNRTKGFRRHGETEAMLWRSD